MDPSEPYPEVRTFPGFTAPPRPLDVEVPRLRLVRLLARRWERPVTLVVAGPGFGKTTVLAQAHRANLLAPRGIDVWVDCEAAHENPVLLARALLAALSTEDHARPSPGVRDVVDALIRLAPVEVCLLLDDVHEIPPGSPGSALLDGVLRALPATAHLVLSGREAPDLPLARREAAGELLRIDAEDLSFTDVESRALGRRLGRESTPAHALRGWPALVRLAFEAGPSAPWRYAREEVLGGLPDPERRALAALAALHTADATEIAEVTGEQVALDDLARRVPLVRVLDDGRYRAHDLWTEALAATMTEREARDLHRRAATVLTARGDLARAGALACRMRDWTLLADLAVDLVNTTLSALPREIAERWLAALPPTAADEPAFVLLRAAVIHAHDFADPRIDSLLDRAWCGLRDRAAAVVLAQAVITAHSRADMIRLAELADRAVHLDGPPTPMARLLRHSAAATLAEVGGYPEAALAEIVQAPVLDVPPVIALATARFHHHCLDMCGFGAEAAALADRTATGSADEHVRLAAAVARWFDGDPADLARLRAGLSRGPGAVVGTARDAFVTAAFLAVIASCCGDVPPTCGDPDTYDNPRDAVLACAARAAIAVAGGDESAARREYAHHLARWSIEVPFNERHLRRFLALGYVLSDELRSRWDAADLGPSHRKAREAARALVRSRAGRTTSLTPEHALCFLPLPWSVELAARLADGRGGVDLGRRLTDALGPAVHREFRRASRSTCPALATGAARLLAALPPPPAHRIGVDVLGPLRVTRDGVPVDAPQLRRVRVRQLLGALVLTPVLARGRALDLLWPELDPVSAARNLRVTLTHLRSLIGGDATFHLRADGDTIRLVRSDWLSADVWTFDESAARVDRARAEGDVDRAKDLLSTAVALWRGDPLPDLRNLPDPDVAIEVDRIRAQHVRHLLELGELRLVSGDTAGAAHLAVRALVAEPYDARGHRLALAAALKGRDPRRIAAVRGSVLAALRQLGVRPDPATGLLLRQALPPHR